MGRKKKVNFWTPVSLDTLYECWKEGKNTQERINLIEKNLTKVPLPTALSMMRKLAKSDPKWMRWATRKKNEAEKEKLVKEKEKERKRKEKEHRRVERETKRKIREENLKDKKDRETLKSKINHTYVSYISDKVPPEFFFCPDVHQFVNNNSCIFRVFSQDKKYNISHGGPCEKCRRMDKFIPILKELINDRRKAKAPASATDRLIRSQTEKRRKNKIKKS